MPPVRIPTTAAFGLAGFAAGLGLGLALGPVPAGVAAGVLVVVGAGSSAGARLICFVALAGMGHGGVARVLDRGRCAARFQAGAVAVRARVVEPAPPGRPVRILPLEAGCAGFVAARFRGPDTVQAGALVRVTGTWTPRPGALRPHDGLLAVEATALDAVRPDASDRLRNRLIRTVGRLYGPRAGMIEALLLGTRGTIDPEVSAAFGRTGLVHLLSISGFHVGLVWAWLLLVFRLARLPRQAPVAAAVVVVGYVAFIGAPPPAVRAAWLAIVVAVERHRQRQPRTGALFAAVAWLVLIVDPWAIADLGAWLSATALWGATSASRWSDRAIGPGSIWRMLSGSIGATVATAPITALAFGAVPLAGIALNLVAIPVTALAVPAVVASLVVDPVAPGLAASFAGGGGSLLAVLELLADRGAAIPGAALTFDEGPASAALAVVAVLVVVWAFGTRHTLREAGRRLVFVAGVAGAVQSVASLAPRAHTGSRLTLHFLDVGQGDAALLETPGGHWVLVDAGPADDRRNAGRRVIVPFLRRHGVRRLDAAFLSHAHRDHYGGLGAVLSAIPVERVFDPAVAAPDREYFALLEQVADRGIRWYPTRRGARLSIDGVTIEALHPDSTWGGWGEDLNEDSAVLRVSAGDFSALFPGDAGFPVEARLGPEVKPVDLLKVGHHGSRWATGSAWIAAVRPRVAVISVGRNNYGHPSPEAIGRLEAGNAAVWRTDRDGSVTVTVDETMMRITSRRAEARFPIR